MVIKNGKGKIGSIKLLSQNLESRVICNIPQDLPASITRPDDKGVHLSGVTYVHMYTHARADAALERAISPEGFKNYLSWFGVIGLLSFRKYTMATVVAGASSMGCFLL